MYENKNINIMEILKNVPNKFLLSLAVSKRARQIKEGAKPMVEYNPDLPINPIIIALQEISMGKLEVLIEDNKDEDMEYIEEIDKYFEEKIVAEAEPEPEDIKPKKDKDIKKSKFKSLAA